MERLTDGNNVIVTKYGRTTLDVPTRRRGLGAPVADDTRCDEASDEFYLAKCSDGALGAQCPVRNSRFPGGRAEEFGEFAQ
jgi:hypothetical protein